MISNVNNQFKELISEAIYNFFHDDTELEMILKDWLYGICEQASEYEAKAKAFDEIFKLYVGYEDGWIHFPRGSKSFNKEIINVCKYYESGERNAKK